MRHPVTGRFMSGDCERDCLEHCAGLCGVNVEPVADDRPAGSESVHDEPAS